MYSFNFNQQLFARIPIAKQGATGPGFGPALDTLPIETPPLPLPHLDGKNLLRQIKESVLETRKATGQAPHERSGMIAHGELTGKAAWSGIDQLFKQEDPRVAKSGCRSLFLFCVSVGAADATFAKPKTYNLELAKAAADFKRAHGTLPNQGHEFLPPGYAGWGAEIKRLAKENMTLGELLAFYEGFDDPKTGPPAGKMAKRKQIIKAAIRCRSEDGDLPKIGRKYLPEDCVGWVQTRKNLRRDGTTLEQIVAAHEKVDVRHGAPVRRPLPDDIVIAGAAIAYREKTGLLPKIGNEYLPVDCPGWGIVKARLKERGLTLGRLLEHYPDATKPVQDERRNGSPDLQQSVPDPLSVSRLRVSFSLANDNAFGNVVRARQLNVQFLVASAETKKSGGFVSAFFVDDLARFTKLRIA